MFVKLLILSLFLICRADCFSLQPSEKKLTTLYQSLDPTSLAHHLAFYELYPATPLGQQALKEAWQILAGMDLDQRKFTHSMLLPAKLVHTLMTLINKPLDQKLSPLDSSVAEILAKLATRLHHYRLKGHHVWTEQDMLALPLEEIDLARGLFLSQFGADQSLIQAYEAFIDLMALQILVRLPKEASFQDKITVINAFIFDEMGFRFPPHSVYTQNLDLYTFLPSVLDSRRGVCLGVSILYLCLAQRLALPLEIITPPGHIYLRHRSGNELINIETTARGIHLDSEEYLSVNICSLPQRTLREVIGMAHMNHASVYWQRGEYEKALEAYQKAKPYLHEDPLLKELMGYTFLLTGQQQRGEQLLREVKDVIPKHMVVQNTLIEDYFLGHVDANGIGILFTQVDDDRLSILAKKQTLETTLAKYPRFRAGLLNLAMTWLQLHRTKEALETLTLYQTLHDDDPEVHYELAILHAQRRDFTKAWSHLRRAETIVNAHDHQPKALKSLRRQLLSYCPE